MSVTTVAITSDLLLGAAAPNSIHSLVDALAGSGAEAVVLAGNIGENDSQIAQFFKKIRLALSCPVAFVPGNQDLFYRNETSSESLLNTHLPALCQANGIQFLPGNPLVVGSLGIVGSMAWYDYSAADPTANLSMEDHVQFRQDRNVPEALRIDWGWSDQEVAEQSARLLETDIGKLSSQPAVNRVLAVTHFPVFDWQVPRDPGNRLAALRNAYEGNLNIGRQLMAHPLVRGVVSAHVPHGGCRVIHRDPLAPSPTWLVGSSPDTPGFVLARVAKPQENS